MDKEKEIEEMAKELHCATSESFISCRKIARILVERRGYGNVKQAVKEYAEELKERACAVRNSTFDRRLVVDVATIDRLTAELYGAGE